MSETTQSRPLPHTAVRPASPTRWSPTSSPQPLLGVFRAEWLKFWTLRSNRVLTIVATVFVPLNALAWTASLRQRATDPDISKYIPTVGAFTFVDSVLWLQLLIAVIAVLCATIEYSGQLGVSFLATPTRMPVAFAKATVLGLIAFVVGAAGTAVGLLIPLATLVGSRVTYTATGADIVGLALKSGGYLAGIALVSYGIAVLVKNLVGAVLLPIALFTIVPAVLESTGDGVVATISGFLPSSAGRPAIAAFHNPAGLNTTTGLLTLGVWAIAAVVAAALAYRYRDA